MTAMAIGRKTPARKAPARKTASRATQEARGADRPRVQRRSRSPARAWERMATWVIMLIIRRRDFGRRAGLPACPGNGPWRESAPGSSDLGFAVKRVQVTGVKHMDRLTVYNIALDQQRAAMTDVDLDRGADSACWAMAGSPMRACHGGCPIRWWSTCDRARAGSDLAA